MSKVLLLDYGYVQLIEGWGSDERIVEAARMSTDKGFLGWGTPEKPKDERLLRHLYTKKHSSPFEMGGMVVEVKAPIFVFREWMRHRTQSYNEMSARYVPLPDDNYLPSVERLLSGANTKTTNKQAQGSGKELTEDEAYAWLERLSVAYEDIEDVYQYGLQLGIPKELARIVLPVARYSKMRASANLRNWLAFMMLRQSSDAQYEIRVYADAVSDLIRQNFPRTWELYEEERLRATREQHSTRRGSLQKLADRAVGLYRGQWARLFRG
ncbi:FAD-dependent thymidylate synthase [Pirellulaceae bacterium SH501]